MAPQTIAADARLLVCTDGYECFGRRRAAGGITREVDSVPGAVKVVAAKTQATHTVVVTRLSKPWKSLVRIANISDVAGEAKVLSEIVSFCNQFGLPVLGKPKITPKASSGVLVTDVLHEAKRLSNSIRSAKGDFAEAPEDVVAAFQVGVTVSLGLTGGHQTLTFEGSLLAAWFGLVNTKLPNYKGCDFCRGVNVSRYKARFCSDFCRDSHHKRILRS